MDSLLTIDDLGSYAAVTRTSSGGWVVPARITRVGIFRYLINGEPVRVLRLPEDIFADESLASLARCPITVYHPSEREVTPDNYCRVNKGYLESPEVVANTYVSAKLVVQDAETGARLDPITGDLKDISAGYRALFALKPGAVRAETPDKQDPKDFLSGVDKNYGPYDRRHVSIRYNHVSIGPKGWGRAGGDVGVTLDGDYIRVMESLFNDDGAAPVTPVAPSTVVVDMSQFVSKSEFDKLSAERDVLKTQVGKLTTDNAQLVTDSSPVELDKRVAARSSLITAAKTLAPDLVTDGLSDFAVRTGALGAFDSSIVLAGKSPDYVQAAFDFAVGSRKTVVASHEKAKDVLGAKTTDSAADPLVAAQTASRAAYVKA